MVSFSSSSATPDMSTKKKWNRNPLLPNSRDKKVMEVSQVKHYYLKTKAVSESVSKCLRFIQKSHNAAAASWDMQSSSNKIFLLTPTMINRLALIIITEGWL